jgi:PmbA protein
LNLEKTAAKMLDMLVGQGATQAEVFLENGSRLRIDVRQQKIEYVKQENFHGMGLRVYVGQRMAFVDTADFSEENLKSMAQKAVELAKMAGADPDHGLPENKGKVTARSVVDRNVASIGLDKKLARIMETERLAMDHSPIITLSNGASYVDVHRTVTIANNTGLLHTYEETKFSTAVSVVATKGEHKMDGSDDCRRRVYRNLKSPQQMAQRAGQMAVSLVGGEPVPSQEVPVVFDSRAGKGLIGGLARAVNGKEVHLGNSFLADMLGKTVASKLVTIEDDGTLLKGLGSAPVDGEGVATRRKLVVDQGVLKTFLYDTYGAQKAGAVSTGNGIRGSYGDLPGIGITNFYMFKGSTPHDELIRGLEKGLYVAETIGFGANTTTGGYSAGAFGRWIEKGELTKPVARVTIAGNLLDILTSIDAVSDNLEFNGRICCPSFRVSRMTVAGT